MPEVLLERAGTLLIHKPAGVSSQMRVDADGVSIIERVRRNGFPRAELPHRLDRMTGGVLVVAASYVLFNLLADVAQTLVDPRLR